MQIRWKLRMAAAQREVWTGAQLQRLLAEKAGLELSSASVSALFTKQPSQIKLTTLIALCTRRSRSLLRLTTRRRRGGAVRCRRSERDAADPGLSAVRPRGRQARPWPVRSLPLGAHARAGQTPLPVLRRRPRPAARHRPLCSTWHSPA